MRRNGVSHAWRKAGVLYFLQGRIFARWLLTTAAKTGRVWVYTRNINIEIKKRAGTKKRLVLQEDKKLKDINSNEKSHRAHTQFAHISSKDREDSQRKQGQFFLAISSLGYQTVRRDWRGVKTNVIEQDESEKTSTKRRTWTEGFETGMANIMWVVMNVRPAESRV